MIKSVVCSTILALAYSPHLRGLLDNDVLDVELVLVKTVDLAVGLGVLEEREQELGRPGERRPRGERSSQEHALRGVCHVFDIRQKERRANSLDRPATLNDAVDLGLGGTADGTVVAAEGDTLGVGLDVLKELDSLGEGQATDSGGRLAAERGGSAAPISFARRVSRPHPLPFRSSRGTHRVFL